MALLQLAKDQKEFEVKDGTPLIEILRDEDVSVQFSCEEGMCCVCECIISEGAENLSEPTEEELDMFFEDEEKVNHRLACQSKIMQGKVVIKGGMF